MSEMIICGLSMEMEMAKEMGWIGKCRGCLHNLVYVDGVKGIVFCDKKGRVRERENCEDWIVDHR